MPIVSKAQQRLMYATTGGANTGVPMKVAQEFINATPKDRFKKLKERVKRK